MLRHLFLFFLLSGAALLNAAEVDDLYRVEVPVADQGQEERNRAIQLGFEKVLIKVTGNRNIAQKSALQNVFGTASRYVQQYRYRVEQPEISTDAEAEVADEKRFLQVFYDKLAVDRMLRERGLPVWGKSRPQVLAWVGFESRGKRKLLIPEFNPQVVGMLNNMSDDRGIPMLLPLMDLEDQSALSASDLWGAFDKPVRDASGRYDPDVILLITVKSVSDNFWTSDWSLLDGQDVKNWELRGKQLSEVIQLGMHQMSDILAQSYAPAGGNQTQVLNMQVGAVGSFAELLKIQNFLENQETVQDFQVRAIQDDRVILALNLRGGVQAFTQAVNLSGFLLPEEGLAIIPETEIETVTETDTDTDTEQAPEVAGETLQTEVPLVADIQLYYQMR